MEVLAEVGFGNLIDVKRITAIVNIQGAWARRMLSMYTQGGMVIDATEGRKMRSIVFLDTGQIVVSFLTATALGKWMANHNYLIGERKDDAKQTDVNEGAPVN